MLLILLSSCNAVKRVKEGQLLLTKNTVFVNDKKVNNDDVNGLISQKPNSKLRLHIYNIARENPDSLYGSKLQKRLDSMGFIDKVVSKKQLRQVANYKTGFNNWLKRTGESPVIINNERAGKSAERLKLYFDSKGYFNSETSFTVDSIPNKAKRGEVGYYVTTGQAYTIDSISRKIASADLDSIYRKHQNLSLIKEKQQFDLALFAAERERLNSLFLNNGVFGFQPSSITFDVLRDTLKENEDYKMPVTLRIDNNSRRINNTVTEIPYKVHTVKNVNIYADYDFITSKDSLQSVQHNNYTIYFKDKLRYKPKALTDAVAIIPGDIYREDKKTLTYRQISNLRTFKYPNIPLTYADSTNAQLEASIYLASRPRFSLTFNADVSHSNIQDVGLAFSTSLVSLNVFRGAETLELAFRGNIGASRDFRAADSRFFNISEFGADLRLKFPRMWFPVNTDAVIPKSMSPSTLVSLGTSFQTNIGLDKQTITSILNYSWQPNQSINHRIDLVNVQYVKNLNPDNFFNVYQNSYNSLNEVAQNSNYIFNNPETEQLEIPEETDSFIDLALTPGNGLGLNVDQTLQVASIAQRQIRLTENNLIFAANYTFTKNSRQNADDRSFYFWRWKVETAGNTLSTISGLANFEENQNGAKLITGVPFSQYTKGETEFIKHFALGRNNVLAFRAFAGLAVPYGNSTNIPFIRSYFAGGSNDNRGWLAYQLGPGSSGGLLDFNEANFKLAFNAEYRFTLLGDLKGAIFTDVGNIWNVFDDIEIPEYRFDGFKDLSELAMAAGPALRYDFSFLVLRFDLGFKIYDPSVFFEKKWFRDLSLSNTVLNIGINYPF